MSFKATPDHYFTVGILSAIAFHLLIPLKQLVIFPYRLLGLLLVVMGYLLVRKTNGLLTRHQTSTQPFEAPRAFISTGPFRFSRNPIYLGMALMLFAVAWLLGSLSSFAVVVGFVICMSVLVIPDEEQALEQAFKEEYLEYKKKVRRWV